MRGPTQSQREPAPAPLTDARALLARPDIDAVSICLPDREHTEPRSPRPRRGKAILLEKPLAHDAAHAQAIVEAVEKERRRD